MNPNVNVFEGSQIDLEEYCELQRASFGKLLQESGVSEDYLTPKYFRWKYSPPAAPARIAVVTIDRKSVACNAMFPVLMRSQRGDFIGWQSCDTATNPVHRGKGYFRLCYEALWGSLNADGFIFGFPNKDSRRGFEKFGWKELQVVNTFVSPFSFSFTKDQVRTMPIGQANWDELDAGQVIPRKFTHVVRSRDYLKWRYQDHPIHQYQLFVSLHSADQHGFAIARTANVKGMRVVMIMELIAASSKTRHSLIRAIKSWARTQKVSVLMLMDTTIKSFEALRFGFCRIPHAFMPKLQVVMGAPKKPSLMSQINCPWFVQLGDWDSF